MEKLYLGRSSQQTLPAGLYEESPLFCLCSVSLIICYHHLLMISFDWIRTFITRTQDHLLLFIKPKCVLSKTLRKKQRKYNMEWIEIKLKRFTYSRKTLKIIFSSNRKTITSININEKNNNYTVILYITATVYEKYFIVNLTGALLENPEAFAKSSCPTITFPWYFL